MLATKTLMLECIFVHALNNECRFSHIPPIWPDKCLPIPNIYVYGLIERMRIMHSIWLLSAHQSNQSIVIDDQGVSYRFKTNSRFPIKAVFESVWQATPSYKSRKQSINITSPNKMFIPFACLLISTFISLQQVNNIEMWFK